MVAEEQRPKRFYEKYCEVYADLTEGLVVEGEIRGSGKRANIRLRGRVEGNIRVSGVVEVCEGALCRGTVEAACILASGQVDGGLHATEKIELRDTALINGDLDTPHLAVAAGCRFNGSVKSGSTRRHDFTERRRKPAGKG